MAQDGEQPAAALLRALHGVLGRVAEPSAVLKTLLREAILQAGADRGAFVEVDRDGSLHYRVLYRFERDDFSGGSGEYSRTILANVLKAQRATRLDNVLRDPRFSGTESIQGLGMASVLCLPIRAEDRIAALVYLESERPGRFGESEQRLVESLLELAGPLLEALHAGQQALGEAERLRAAESGARQALAETQELLARDWSFGRFLGRSAAVSLLESQVAKAAASDFPVLIGGETGTGKSLLARVIHHAGPRRAKAFVTLFCPSLERGMVETELFGHRRGAFTGAVTDRIGKVQAAEGGTLFLDEVCELPLEIQPKLLRLLQEKTFERVGDARELTANVRVIAASNRDVEAEARAGRFRRDLFERLNFLPLQVPPLRERREDLPLLLRHFLDRTPAGRWVELTPEAEDLLQRIELAWAGNVRQVEQLAARIAVDGLRGQLGADELLARLGSAVADAAADVETGSDAAPGLADKGRHGELGAEAAKPSLDAGLGALMEHSERAWLSEALRRYPELTRAQLAEKLRISPAALYKKLRQHDLSR